MHPNWLKVVKENRIWFIAGFLIVSGLLMMAFSFHQTVRIILDDRVIEEKTFAIRPIGVLNEVGINITEADQVSPPPYRLFFSPNIIRVKKAQAFLVTRDDRVDIVNSVDLIPANILQQAGIPLFPKDILRINGDLVDPYQALPAGRSIVLQFEQAIPISLSIDGIASTIYSAQPTLGLALAEAGISIHPKDTLSVDLDTALLAPINLDILRARQISITVDSKLVSGLSSAQTVGEVVHDLGLSLQGLDYTTPPESAPVPTDGNIQLTRVREALVIQKIETPFTSTYAPDPYTEIDQYSVVQPGQVGLAITRSRIKFENGREISREEDPAWKASDPQPGILGYGTKVVTRTEVVDGQTIEYWRKISVYATSYAPCKQGYSYCTTATASGIPLEKGIVAVLPSWYRDMKFQSVYIPGYGYGTIADTGGGIPGRPWIDLGFSEEDYESWHFWTTMYFLTPVPTYIPYLLP
jgi:uncharacterized protein YabE (DUF348 family)